MRFIYLLFLLPFTASAQCDPEGILLELQATTDLNGLLFGETGCIEAVTIGSPLTFTGGTLDITTGNLTAGSTKVAVTGGTGAVIGAGATVDVVPGNILLSTLGGSLNLSQIAHGGATTNQLLQWNGTTWAPATISTGSGTVTSVGLTMPSGFSVGSSPVTTSGTIAVTTTLNGPLRGNGSGFTTGNTSLTSEVSGILPIANGGTNLSALGTANQLLRVNSGATALEYFTPSFLTGNQTITLSGDVTGSGTTAITTTIANNAVTVAKMQTLAGLSVLGRSANSTGNMAAITGTAANQYLRVNSGGTALEWGAITAVTGSGAAGQGTYWTGTNTIAGSVVYLVDVTNGRIQLNTTGSAVTPTAHYDLRVGTVSGNDIAAHLQGSVSNDWTATLYNTRSAAGGANSIWEAKVAATTSGDPFYRAIVTGGETWSWGADNSDADKFKLRPQVDLATGATGGEGLTITAAVTPLVGINTDAPAHPLDVNGIARALTWTSRTDATGATSTFGLGAGGSPSLFAAVYPNGNMGTIRFTTGSSPTANAVIVNVVPPAAVRHANKIYVTFSPLNAATAGEIDKFYIDPSGTAPGNIAFKSNGALTAATEYYLSFIVMGHQ